MGRCCCFLLRPVELVLALGDRFVWPIEERKAFDRSAIDALSDAGRTDTRMPTHSPRHAAPRHATPWTRVRTNVRADDGEAAASDAGRGKNDGHGRRDPLAAGCMALHACARTGGVWRTAGWPSRVLHAGACDGRGGPQRYDPTSRCDASGPCRPHAAALPLPLPAPPSSPAHLAVRLASRCPCRRRFIDSCFTHCCRCWRLFDALRPPPPPAAGIAPQRIAPQRNLLS